MSEQLLTDIRPRDWVLVSEQFLTHQGEGTSTGELAYFVRFGACNLHCIRCDTPYTWVFDDRHVNFHAAGIKYNPQQELKRVPIDKLANDVLTQPARLIVVTGGEPLLQAVPLSMLISRINESVAAHRFEIETAGTLSPQPLSYFENVAFNVSPKLASSGNTEAERYRPSVLTEFLSYESQFKFVIDWDGRSFKSDLREVESIVGCLGIPDHRVWLMPEGTSEDAILSGLKRLADVAVEHGWNLSGRQHVLCWGNKRGY